MEFNFNFEKCSDLGLVVKHGNKDNVVLFFDEVKEGAVYRALLYRTDIVYAEESFIQKAVIKDSKVTLEITEWVETPNRGSERQCNPHTFETHEMNNQNKCAYSGKELIVQDWENKKCDSYKLEDSPNYISSGVNVDYKLARILKIPFSKVKYVTSLESSRNDLYINIDFLPCGQYLVILQVEDRNGKIIKESLPYYFKVALLSNKEVLDAIRSAGRVAGRY